MHQPDKVRIKEENVTVTVYPHHRNGNTEPVIHISQHHNNKVQTDQYTVTEPIGYDEAENIGLSIVSANAINEHLFKLQSLYSSE